MTSNLFIDQLSDAAVAIDSNHVVTNMNVAAAALLGITSPVIGRSLSSVSGDLFPSIAPFLEATEAQEQIAVRDRDNLTRNLKLWIFPLEDAGQLAGRLLIFHDFTERIHQIENQIQEQEHRFQRLIEKSSDGIALID